MQEVKFADIPKYKGFGWGNKLYRLVWSLVYWILFRTSVYPGGRYVRVALLRMFGANAHRRSLIYPSVKVWIPRNLTIGDRSVLGPNVNCYNPAPITIGKKVTISQNTYLCAGGHDISKVILPFESASITIGDYVWVCANCFVKYGVTIGEGAIVGATSSAFKSVDPWTVVGGNPAKFIKKRELREGSECLERSVMSGASLPV